MEFHRDYLIKKRTTFNIGGRVECYLKAKDLTELAEAVIAAKGAKKELFVMGNLSNVLIADGRIKKVFVELGGSFTKIESAGKNTVYAGAGAKLSSLLGFALANSLSGIEFLAGIPGTAGGAVYMNAGAFGKGIGAFIKKIYFMDNSGKCGVITNPEKAFSYRNSIFQKNGLIITGADLRLKKGKKEAIRKEMTGIIKLRHSKHPWDAWCAGSFFKNAKDYTAGKLIEQAGLKGACVGKAQVSEMHANFLINKGGATYKDVIKLADKVKKEVYRKFGIRLEEEVRFVK